ncbi:GNAT family N-acetyltransferase [Roseateles sp. SL47]|uniref:GNAT family N-acetyltransferase n=1 Tax=Roseateles sp. SL47 TaxID=2995138 RepID=UPI002270673F|nr:GNAT family N-acetyltransferase [Roseateles sp. SL47]WAC72586.1 GNAT family N-acetyltransferase [Roseateles sp. SL47]
MRRPTPDDGPAHSALMSHPEVQPWLLGLPYVSPEAWRQRFSTTPDIQSAELTLLALQGDTLVGSAGLHPVGPHPRRRHAMSMGISVLPQVQGQGVASALMSALLRQADDWLGVLRVELTVFADNHRAIRLYERFNFAHEGRLRAYALREGRYMDCLSMARLHPSPPVWTPGG